MVLTDKHLQIATGVAFSGAVETVTLGDMVDFGTNRRIETGKPIYARLTFPVSGGAAAGATLNAKVEFRFHVSSLQSLANLTAVHYTTATKQWGETGMAHGLVDGTRLNFVSAGGSGSFTTHQPYYVVNATADFFQLSLTPGGAVTAHTIGTNQTDGVLTPHSECVGSTGPTPVQQLAKGDVLHVALNPTPFNGQPPLARYLFCEVVRTLVSNAGTVSIAIVLDPSDYATYYASGFLVE